jgi:EAL domain-containing protein (putative c-di-GMP-specific phosphodiesterase class I)/GGDEF domain-containing protein
MTTLSPRFALSASAQVVPPAAAGLEAPAPGPITSVAALLASQTLQPHFQPIVQLTDGAIFGHEALIRTPAHCAWRSPDELFAAARAEGLTIELEIECVRLSLRAWAQREGQGQLFLNLSAGALVTALAQQDLDVIMNLSRNALVTAGGVVIELTEHEHVRDVDALAAAVTRLRRHRVRFALDDFGDGRSSLSLWSELKTEFVKIDKYFTKDLHRHPEKVQTLRALRQISETLSATLVAEGIETADDLRIVRDLGIGLGQGWALGRPQAQPLAAIPAEALGVIASKAIAVFPERRRATQHRATARSLMHDVEPAAPATLNEELFARFNDDETLLAVAIVDNETPVGLISRQRFLDRYAKPFVRELYGRHACTLFANLTPKLVELDAGIDELTAVLTSDDQRYLSEGFVITEGGHYRGLGHGEALVRTVTESRIEAARHANPLTLLPGNIPLTQHIQRLQLSGSEFVACYSDLNQFKPFNDQYGYWRGDEMIQLAAKCIAAHVDARRDFVGHVGGDDFVVLFQSDDWDLRCHAIVDSFNDLAKGLFDSEALAAGGLMAEDRYGHMHFHPLTTMSIGAVRVWGHPGNSGPEDVANAAARAKRLAKRNGLGVYVLNEAQRGAAGHQAL